MYGEEFWETLLEEGDIDALYDAYLAHDARALPVPMDVMAKLDEHGYAVNKWDWDEEDDGQPDEDQEWFDYDKEC
jgi:hypothetical protein